MVSQPVQRLEQVTSHLSIKSNSNSSPHASRFRPSLPDGLPINYTPLNPLSFLLKAASIRPDHLAIIHPARNLEFTFREWALRVKDLAYALKARGLERGDRVLTLLPNLPSHLDALQAAAAAQMIIVPINTRLSSVDVGYIIEDSGSRLLLVDSELAHLLPTDLDRRGVQVVICRDEDGDDYEELLREGQAYDRSHGNQEWSGLPFVKDENSTFAISYTSGTTSRPKGVETSYRSTYLAAVANAHEARLDDRSRFLWTLPMFHCCGWCFPYATTLAMCTSVCLRGVGDYSEVWRGLQDRGVTHYCAAPTVQLSIANHAMARPLGRPVRTVIAGSAPTATLIKALESLDLTVVHVWGMTETLGPLTRTYYVGDQTSPDYYRNMARQGFSFLTSDDIRVVKLAPEGGEEEEGSDRSAAAAPLVEVAADGQEVGEIVCRGNITMKGYWNNPSATRKAFRGGWLNTGDLAVRFPDGTFAITDRSKDLIISGGENISSLSVENAISSHDDVLETAVVARKHEKWGERPHAFIVLKPQAHERWASSSSSSSNGPPREAAAVDVDRRFELELKQFLRGKVPAFAIPDSVSVLTARAFDQTKTATGKVQKKELREMVHKMDS